MRGEKTNQAQDLITDAVSKAEELLGGPHRKGSTVTATIVARDGTELFHVVPSTWSKLVAIGYALLLLVCVTLATLIYYNNVQINYLEKKVEQHSADPACCNSTKENK